MSQRTGRDGSLAQLSGEKMDGKVGSSDETTAESGGGSDQGWVRKVGTVKAEGVAPVSHLESEGHACHADRV